MAFTTARLNAAIDAALSGADYIRIHDGAPGSAGTSNAVAKGTLTGVGSATGAEDEITSAVTIPSAMGPLGYFSLWDGDPDSGGVCLASGSDQTLTPAETFAGAGTLNVTVTVAAS